MNDERMKKTPFSFIPTSFMLHRSGKEMTVVDGP
jgi:hypothetical protein